MLAPVLISLVSPGTSGQVHRLSTPRLVSLNRSVATHAARSTTSDTSTSRTTDTDPTTLMGLASPFYTPPPPPPPPPAAVAAPSPPAPPPAVASAGPQLPPPANKATRRRSQKGQASWYQIHNGTCAHKTLPKGTLVRVVNVENNKEIICRVADRGPYPDGRIIDLDLDGFKQLANRSEGVVEVRINW